MNLPKNNKQHLTYNLFKNSYFLYIHIYVCYILFLKSQIKVKMDGQLC